ncbi:MAG: carbamoyltransferase HypF [Acidimicrobiales bacterium]
MSELRQLTERRRVRVTGTVQGVGFRPFVFRHAVALGLVGFVLNDSSGVLIEVEGEHTEVAELCRLLSEAPPPLARVTSVDWATLPSDGTFDSFRIVDSTADRVPNVAVSVDSATCDDCLSEVDDPHDRRYGYPFTNCTNCGPRYTIVLSVPYDRPATTMAGFKMCAECQAEYEDPADRRFHAQPNACPSCGPRIAFYHPTGRLLAEAGAALDAVVEALCAGQIIAIKGIGGYHLACDASNHEAVAELRRRKARDDKPFALMATDLEMARSMCVLDPGAESALGCVARPIVLACRKPGAAVADGVAPGMPDLGLMLPYTPLHHLLMAKVARPLVMSSGNQSDDPIAHTDEDAFTRLGPMVDAVLAHDRRIHVRCDDSVVRATGRRLQMVRRSRGYAPEALLLPRESARQVLAVGAELKSTVSVAKKSLVVCSHHIGDLEHLATYQAFLQATVHLCRLFGIEPEVVAHDLHPEYLSTKHALDLDLEPWPVQHHHAHIASCLAEHGHTGTVLGIAFDGLGYGTDGTMWGGEFLVADFNGFERAAHLQPVPMPGGPAAVREPWRMALAWTVRAAGADAAARLGAALDPRWSQVLPLAVADSERRHSILTTSVGRLFDAVAVLVGLRSQVTYEGQAAIELEVLARSVPRTSAPEYPTEIVEAASPEGFDVLDPSPLIATVLTEVERGTDRSVIAAGFHEGLGRATAALGARLARRHGLDTVALSGGVFQNVRFSDIVEDALATEGLTVLVHESVPPNDGGISVGQAAIAALGTRPD